MLYSSALLLLLLSLLCGGLRCPQIPSYDGKETDPVFFLSGGTPEPCVLEDVQFMAEASQGRFGVKFRVPRKLCNEHRFDLGDTELRDCAESSINVPSGSIQLLQENKTAGKCIEVENVTAGGNYSSYYCTLVEEFSNCSQVIKYLNSSFLLSAFSEPTLTPQPQVDRGKVMVTLNNYRHINKVQLTLRPEEDPECRSKGTSDGNRLTAILTRDDEGAVMCSQISCDSGTKDLRCNKINCFEETSSLLQSISCYFSDVPAGSYCVYMHIEDEPACKLSHRCDLFRHFIVSPLEQPTEQEESDTSLLVALMFGCLLAAVFFVLIVLHCIRSKMPVQVNPDIYEEEWPQSSEILLLYPRDCDVFMDTMVAFRQLLRRATGCQVYDCFEPQLSGNMMEWVQWLVSQSGVKVVILETPCAVLHHEALLQRRTVSYSFPTCLDQLFLCGLHTLIDSCDRNNYLKLFVVRLEGFTDERASLKHLTPYRRYSIPLQLDALLSHLGRRSSNRDICSEEVSGFLQQLNTVVNYRRLHPRYLEEMLVIKASPSVTGTRHVEV